MREKKKFGKRTDNKRLPNDNAIKETFGIVNSGNQHRRKITMKNINDMLIYITCLVFSVLFGIFGGAILFGIIFEAIPFEMILLSIFFFIFTSIFAVIYKKVKEYEKWRREQDKQFRLYEEEIVSGLLKRDRML